VVLDSVVKLSEKLVELLKYRSERKGRQFSLLIQPLFESLKVVHQDYLRVFENSRTELESGVPLATVATNVQTRRVEEEAERSAIREQAHTLTQDEALADFRPFFEAVVNYFQPGRFLRRSSRSVHWFMQLKAAAKAEGKIQLLRGDEPDQRLKLLLANEVQLRLLRKDWDDVCMQYAKAQASAVG
jgi:hypothetical protein